MDALGNLLLDESLDSPIDGNFLGFVDVTLNNIEIVLFYEAKMTLLGKHSITKMFQHEHFLKS